MRMVREAGPEILRIGRGRATQYGLRQVWPNLDSSRFPLFRIRESGTAVAAGDLITLTAHQTAWMPMARVVSGLPAELADARPSGFLGRHFAAANADLRLPPRLSDWSDHHILLAMSRRGRRFLRGFYLGERNLLQQAGNKRCFIKGKNFPGPAQETKRGELPHPPASRAQAQKAGIANTQ